MAEYFTTRAQAEIFIQEWHTKDGTTPVFFARILNHGDEKWIVNYDSRQNSSTSPHITGTGQSFARNSHSHRRSMAGPGRGARRGSCRSDLSRKRACSTAADSRPPRIPRQQPAAPARTPRVSHKATERVFSRLLARWPSSRRVSIRRGRCLGASIGRSRGELQGIGERCAPNSVLRRRLDVGHRELRVFSLHGTRKALESNVWRTSGHDLQRA